MDLNSSRPFDNYADYAAALHDVINLSTTFLQAYQNQFTLPFCKRFNDESELINKG